MGFEPQVRSIANHVRPNRQTLLFSATFKKKIEKLAREILSDPIRIIQGELGEANENITQKVLVFSEGPDKWAWVNSKLVEFTSLGKVLVFVTQKTNAAEFEKNLVENGFKACLLHGDMHQDDRTKVINEFKKTDMPILVATDVAARGLDIPAIKTVINYDVARDIDTHTHRIGRTGRAGEKGVAYTLVTAKDKEFCPLLVRNLESADQEVPQSLLDLAMQVNLIWMCNYFGVFLILFKIFSYLGLKIKEVNKIQTEVRVIKEDLVAVVVVAALKVELVVAVGLFDTKKGLVLDLNQMIHLK